MKIFNWVHQKLNGQPSPVPLHPQKGEVNINIQVKSGDEDTEALLGLRDGLLAIGTLGLRTDHHHPHADYIMTIIPNLKVFDYPNISAREVEYLNEPKLMEEISIGEEDDEMPLVFNGYSTHDHDKEEVDEDEKKFLPSIKTEDATDIKENNEKGDRTTLADLFKAEAVATQRCFGNSPVSVLKDNSKNDDEEIGKHKKFPSYLPGKLVKKLILSHDVQPIKKINHMMGKMMKRKIHPELLRQKPVSGIILDDKNHVLINEVPRLKGMALLPPEPFVVD